MVALAILEFESAGTVKIAAKARDWVRKVVKAQEALPDTDRGMLRFDAERDNERALAMLKALASSQCLEAMWLLGTCYERGIGVERDAEEAKAWYAKAGSLGSKEAMAKLSEPPPLSDSRPSSRAAMEQTPRPGQ